MRRIGHIPTSLPSEPNMPNRDSTAQPSRPCCCSAPPRTWGMGVLHIAVEIGYCLALSVVLYLATVVAVYGVTIILWLLISVLKGLFHAP